MSISISGSSAILVVGSFFFALGVTVTSGFVEVFESLVGVIECGFTLGDIVVHAGQLGLHVGEV